MKLVGIRVFHYEKESGDYSFEDFRGTVQIERGLRSESGGSRRYCDSSVRLMTDGDVKAEAGDYVSLGKADRPDKESDFYISAIRDNRRGSMPHWRLLARKETGR